MYKAAQTELAVLRKLGAADPENKKHCIRLIRHFDYRNHMCLVFESMVGKGGREGPAW
jgi:serine/threonine-protein kinase PRP4